MKLVRTKRVVPISIGVVVVAIGVVLIGGRLRSPACSPTTSHPEWSVARQWDEAVLDAIRRDLPAPTVHARNLFHMSVAMWDAWAAYDDDANGVLVDEKHSASDVSAARDEAISYAAYRVLEHRYSNAVGASDSIPAFDDLMEALCYPIDVVTTTGDSPAALGNRIASIVIAHGLEDGSREADRYDDPSYEPVNHALVVAASGSEMVDPNRWQPLEIENMMSQNGVPIANGTQVFIDPHWGLVTAFALTDGGSAGLPLDPGPPPYLGDPQSDQEFKDAAVEVIGFSSLLDPTRVDTIDVSPGAIGANPLGTYDGTGHPINPATGAAYVSNLVSQTDFHKAVAEYWADGPKSETPPGHWNSVANSVSDSLAPDLRMGGVGPPLERLEWDVKLYLAVNGANHDAAIAAWGAKRHYDTSRPISMIRYMGGKGQSSDSNGSSYHPEGLPLVPGLIEVITDATTGPGGIHEHLAAHVGEIAVRAWLGTPEDRETQFGGVDWIRAVDWSTYQLPTFVTPAFGAYVSGHSTFSRASAEVLAAMTGDEFFPGGLGEWTIPVDGFHLEAGPDRAVTLQWATYFDAADQAGISRLYGGIHVRADDLAGRMMGAEIGRAAWGRALHYFGEDG